MNASMKAGLAAAAAVAAVSTCAVAPPAKADGAPHGNAAGMSPNRSPVAPSASAANEKAAFNYFVHTAGYSEVQSAAIVGNLIQESGVNPTAKQYPSGPGRGIAQWSLGGRWDSDVRDNMVWFAPQPPKESVWSLHAQLGFVWYELRHFSNYGGADLKKATTVSSAVKAFETKFEGCGTCKSADRVKYANAVLKKYGS